VIEYHLRVAETLLPHLVGWPACGAAPAGSMRLASAPYSLICCKRWWAPLSRPRLNGTNSTAVCVRIAGTWANIFRRLEQRDDAFSAIDRQGFAIDPNRLAQLKD